MKYENIYDTHTHSIHSFDGKCSVNDLCEAALKHGAKGIYVTDHCDIDGILEKCWDFEDKQFNDVAKSKKKFDNILKVYCGVELGQGIYKKELSQKFLEKYDFDYVIGSVHNLENMEDFYFLDYKKFDIYELLNRYFNDILETAKWNMTDSIAHLTYPLRYIVAREHIDVDMARFDNIITEIFEVLIKNDKALELNVSGLTMDINDTLPNKKYIKKFHDLGGKYVTIGSDAHVTDKICENIDIGLEILKECGYTHFTIFEKRIPKLIEIR